MSLIERFTERLGAIERPLSFQVLFPEVFDLDADGLAQAIRSFHPDLRQARVELMGVAHRDEPDSANESAAESESPSISGRSLLGLASWGAHIVQLVGFPAPIPQKAFDTCVRPAHFGQQLKQDASQHKSHLLLYYAGDETDPFEKYVALAVVAAALARFDALLVLNESAQPAFPTAALSADESGEDALGLLRTLPIPMLYGGFVKLEVEGEPGVWMRTFGNHLLRLPDLAMRTAGHHQGSETFDLFANMLTYLRDSGASFAPGHTMQVGDDVYLKLRAPTLDEWFLESDGEMLVAEYITADDINRP
jgi:Domain of unknown function (DUF4261)